MRGVPSLINGLARYKLSTEPYLCDRLAAAIIARCVVQPMTFDECLGIERVRYTSATNCITVFLSPLHHTKRWFRKHYWGWKLLGWYLNFTIHCRGTQISQILGFHQILIKADNLTRWHD